MKNAKTALVTGSTSGIGLAIAEKLASQGTNLVINGLLEQAQGDALAQSLSEKYQVEVLFDPANLAHPEQIESMFTRAAETFSGIDILVNNAGIQHTAPIEQFDNAKYQAIIAVNLSSVFYAMKAALPHMQQQSWGRIINIASVHGLVASLNKSAYVAAKHGVVGMTKVAALENANNGITANAICPGWVETPLIQQQIDDIASAQKLSFEQAKGQLISAKQPRVEMANPAHIGDLVLFLVSDAAQGMTGTSLPIDGAWTAQ